MAFCKMVASRLLADSPESTFPCWFFPHSIISLSYAAWLSESRSILLLSYSSFPPDTPGHGKFSTVAFPYIGKGHPGPKKWANSWKRDTPGQHTIISFHSTWFYLQIESQPYSSFHAMKKPTHTTPRKASPTVVSLEGPHAYTKVVLLPMRM